MKLNNLHESKKLDQMMVWCENNIQDFTNKYGSITVDEKTNCITAQDLVIQTSDKILPYLIDVEYELEIKKSRLTSLKNIINLDVPSVFFRDQSSINFNNLVNEDGNLYSGLYFSFSDYDNLNAHDFTKNIFNHLNFVSCKSKTLYDFSNYKNNKQIKKLLIYTIENLNTIILNLVSILDASVSINEIDFGYSLHGDKLTEITNNYLNMHNKQDYVMDFTLELLDNEFDASIL